MTLILHFALFAALAWLVWTRLHTLMVYFQQEEYDSARFRDALIRVRLFDIRASLAIIGAALLSFAWSGWLPILSAALVAIAIIERRYTFKKPLAKTERAIRILRLAAGGMVLPVVIASIWPLLGVIAIQLVPFALIAANRILTPMQARINAGFIAEAEDKLARMSPEVIGVTGSFGKTTVKHMLAEILEASAPVFYSRGSINTQLGLTRHIRQRLQWAHRYFIAEMGAYGIGSVQRLCDFVHPQWGIVTSVGDAHTERFGSVDVIAQAKSELAADICRRDGSVVINGDLLKFAPFQELYDANPGHVITVGENASNDIVIASSEMRNGMWHISLRGAMIPDVDYALPLLGEHNVMNSALAMSLAILMAPDHVNDMVSAAANVAQIPHRLQKRERPGDPLIIDDAYNANEIGFTNALSVGHDLANERKGKLILITPGLAELGVQHDVVHTRLGALAAQECDRVVIVNPERIPTFLEAASGAQKAEVSTATDLNAAQQWLRDAAEECDVVVYANDLPDLLEAKRIL